MIDVDRPSATARLWSNPLRFYSHATAASLRFSLCSADWVDIEFDPKGNVHGISTETRYGVVGDIYTSYDQASDKTEKMYSSVKSTRTYFQAPDAQTALEAVYFVDAIHGKGPAPNQQFTYSCTGSCGKGRDRLKWLALGQITSVRCIKCDRQFSSNRIIEVNVREGKEDPGPMTFRVSGDFDPKGVKIASVTASVIPLLY